MLKSSLVAFAVTSYVLIVFNCFCPIYLLFSFFVSSFFKIFWTYSFDLIFDTLLRSFQMIFLSMVINNQLWHASVGLFSNGLNKRNKTIFPLYLSSDLSQRLTCILSLNLRLTHQSCDFLLISVALHCLYIQNFLLLKPGDIESNPGPRKSSTLKF